MAQVSVESLSSIERKISVLVPSAQVDSLYQRELQKVLAKAKIPGFRPGKAPLKTVIAQFGDSIRKDSLSQVIRESLYEALTQEKLQPVTTPEVTPQFSEIGQDFSYTASFEVLPTIETFNFTLDTVKKPKTDIAESDIDLVLSQLQKQFSTWHEVSRPASMGDRLVIEFYPEIDGEADLNRKMENFPIELGSHTMMDGFEDALVGVSIGDNKVISLNFPADFPIPDKAGKPVDFHVVVKKIFENQLPELDLALIKKMGIQSGELEDLRSQVRSTLTQERDRLINAYIQEQVFKHILENNPIEVPKSLIREEAKRIHDEAHGQHEHHHSEEEMQVFLDEAKGRIALSLLLADYAKKHEIRLDEDAVQSKIESLSQLYQKPSEVAEYFSKGDARNGIESRVIEEKIIDSLLQSINIQEMPMTFSELKQRQGLA